MSDEDKGLVWIDMLNYFRYFRRTNICFSMLGSTVHTIRFIKNKNTDFGHNVFFQNKGKLIFKFQLEADARVILSSFFNISKRKKEGQINSKIDFEIINIFDGNKTNVESPELILKKGKYLIIGKFEGIYLSDEVILLVQIYSRENLFFEFIKNIKYNEPINNYQYIFNSEECQTLKRVKKTYQHCEDLREKFLYHKTLIKFLQEKLGCEFTLSGLGFYIDSFKNDKVDCIVRVDKTKTAKFKKIVVSQKIEKSNKPSNICVGESHINGEVVGRGEIWELKGNCTDENYDKPLEAKLIFRGEVVQNKQVKASEKIEDNTISEFHESYNHNNEEEIKNIKRTISKIEIYEKEEDEISVHSELEILNKYNWKRKTPLHPYPGHNLFLCVTERFFGDGYYCNRCKKEFKNTIPSYYCTRCDFDICENCINEKTMLDDSKIGEFDNEGDFWQFKSESHAHPLTYLTLKNDLKLMCDSDKCEHEINNGDYFYFCSACEYHLCENCKQKEKPGNAYQLSCLWHEHPLSFCFPIRPTPAYNCDHCGETKYLKLSFYCTKCDYDLCYECFSKYTKEFKKHEVRIEKNALPNPYIEKFDFQIKSEHKHPLTKSFIALGDGNKKYFQCHICEKSFEKVDVIYLCSECDFKYCISCIEKIGKK